MKKIKIDNFQKIVIEIEKMFINITDKLNLENYWSNDNCFQIEIKKSYIKSILRYLLLTENLLNQICTNYNKKLNKNFKYTNFYPMIHLSNDKVESGGYHFDQVDKINLNTLWLAITKYKYPALSIFKYNFENLFLNKIIINLNLTKYFSENLIVEQGDLNCWDGKLIHSGNLNTSDKPSLAFQMKILSENQDFIFEEVRNFKNSNKSNEYIDQKNLNFYLNNFDLFSDLVNQILGLSNSEDNIDEDFEIALKILKSLKINDDLIKRILSFSLSILSQRIRSNKKLFQSRIDNHYKFCSLIDFCSLIIGAENLISFKRLYFESKKKIF